MTAILIIAMLAGLCAILIWKVFVVKSVSVKGNEIYTDKQIEDWVLDKEYSWNSLYVYFENKCNKTEEIPFVDSLRIRLKSPQKLEITVVEKGILGYLYVPSLGKNAYFDKDGFVVEISSEIIPGVTKPNINNGIIKFRKLPNKELTVKKIRTIQPGKKSPHTIPKAIAIIIRGNRPNFIFFIDNHFLILVFTHNNSNVSGTTMLQQKNESVKFKNFIKSVKLLIARNKIIRPIYLIFTAENKKTR